MINAPINSDYLYVNLPDKSGLGLVIVKKILLLHDVSLQTYSVNDLENVFTFSMPVYNHNMDTNPVIDFLNGRFSTSMYKMVTPYFIPQKI